MSRLIRFYESHLNFSRRTLLEYYISPGIKCKFDTIVGILGNKTFEYALDIGSSGDSVLYFIRGVRSAVTVDLAMIPLTVYTAESSRRFHPVCSDAVSLPFKDESFDLVTALDVLEHIKDDKSAAREIIRTVKPGGTVVITVPHRMKYFTDQDIICGHYRRYEIEEIIELFSGLTLLTVFPVYGKLMKVQFIQKANPSGVETGLDRLRRFYRKNRLFRISWDIFVKVFAFLMKIDAYYRKKKSLMNIGFVFYKPRKKERGGFS